MSHDGDQLLGEANPLRLKNEDIDEEHPAIGEPPLLWPKYIKDRHNYPTHDVAVDTGHRYPTKYFSRSVISKVLGGSKMSKDVKVGKNAKWPYPCEWYKCLMGDWNPHMPKHPGMDGVDLTFEDVPIIPSGFSSCNKGPIPVFCSHGPKKWQYVG